MIHGPIGNAGNPMKTILLPFYDDEVAVSALDQACLVARRFGSYVEGLFVMRPPQIIEAEGIALAGAYITQLKDEWRRRADTAKEQFSQLMGERGIPMGDLSAPAEGPSAGWREVEGPEGQIVGDYGRLFDLIVIGRSSEQALIDWQVMCEAAFFESGRPALVTAASPPETMGENIAIHWNGSTEAARTIALAMPYLCAARSAHVIAVEGGMVPGPEADEVTRHLRRNGVDAQTRMLAPDGRTSGEAILDEAQAVSADLLVKGAYTHNRLRQLVFGGATRHILGTSPIPVLMAH
jgi:nucleotide-binding universal stress UspA family protein